MGTFYYSQLRLSGKYSLLTTKSVTRYEDYFKQQELAGSTHLPFRVIVSL